MTDPKRLPVVGSSAGSTTFCAAKIEGPGGYLWVDGNQKITAGNGSYEDPRPNAFSLEAEAVVQREHNELAARTGRRETYPMLHCPGSTSVCRASCYVHGLEKHASDTYELYRHNSTMIREILGGDPGDARVWSVRFAEWINANAKGGFRWHVSGDVFSEDYARWIALVITGSPNVDHWIYTRSFELVYPLLDLRNLSLNLSCDRENYDAAVQYKAEAEARQLSTPLTLAYLTDDGALPDLPPHSVIFPDYDLRGRGLASPTDSVWWQGLTAMQRKMVCPVDFFGKSPTSRCGPCRKCLL